MPVIAIINRKGGSGKSTLAAHVSAWCAHKGSSVMLGDVDRQQSSRGWLSRRDAALPAIAMWTVDVAGISRVPNHVTHLVLDTPGGMHGFDLQRIVMRADVILMPVGGSLFDRQSAEQCYAELMALPRLKSGRCKLAIVGMRIDESTTSAQSLQNWSAGLGVPFLGVLGDSQAYVRSVDSGMTLFDLPEHTVQKDLAQWQPIVDWLAPLLGLPQNTQDVKIASPQASPTGLGRFLAGTTRYLTLFQRPPPSVLTASRLPGGSYAPTVGRYSVAASEPEIAPQTPPPPTPRQLPLQSL